MSNEYPASRNRSTGKYPVEQKVQAATASSYAVGLILTMAMTVVQDEQVPLLVGFLPELLEPFVLALLPAAAALISGYYAKHQARRGPVITGGPPVGGQ